MNGLGLTEILQVLCLSGIGCIFIFKKYLFSYASEKGKNLATKEDVGEITQKIEDVKHEYARKMQELQHDYAQKLESARAELSAQLSTHGFRYEKEYEVLSELTSNLVDVRDTSVSLRPALDFRDPDKSDEDIKRDRLTRFSEALKSLYIVRERKRPFYSEEIYQAILAIEKKSRRESLEYQHKDPEEGKNFLDYWDSAEKNQEQIIELAEVAMQKIRDRVTKWDPLNQVNS